MLNEWEEQQQNDILSNYMMKYTQKLSQSKVAWGREFSQDPNVVSNFWHSVGVAYYTHTFQSLSNFFFWEPGRVLFFIR